MPDFKIDLTGAMIPTEDGAINTYVNKEAAAQKEHFAPNRRVIFVNGMGNSGTDHAESALALSLVQMCPVIGVFNRSTGFALDLLQCLADKNQFDGRYALSAASKVTLGAFLSSRTPEEVIVKALARNTAQATLFPLLRRPANRYRTIFAHSQGNLILSNVLQGIAAVEGPKAMTGRVVHTFGSPAVNWPPGITRFDHGFTFDAINWLSGFDPTFSISKVGMPDGSLNPFTHGFLEYLQKDPAFVINRFRVGMWGRTFNMDEAGLAKCLVAMGSNMRRVRLIFAYLDAHHNSDADDVAVEYVNLVRKANTTAWALGADRDLVQLLIRILDDGWTSGVEQEAIDWLKGL